MIHIHFIDSKGNEKILVGKAGQTVMEVAIKGGINAIVAECGGACSCATCHCYVDEAWNKILPEGGIMEQDMLDFASNVRPTSRLSCQITLEEAYNGLVIHTPERQG